MFFFIFKITFLTQGDFYFYTMASIVWSQPAFFSVLQTPRPSDSFDKFKMASVLRNVLPQITKLCFCVYVGLLRN